MGKNDIKGLDLRECDSELVGFIAKHYERKKNGKEKMVNIYAEFVIEHAISYLDFLCSLRFDLLSDEDKGRVSETMSLVVKKTAQFQGE